MICTDEHVFGHIRRVSVRWDCAIRSFFEKFHKYKGIHEKEIPSLAY